MRRQAGCLRQQILCSIARQDGLRNMHLALPQDDAVASKTSLYADLQQRKKNSTVQPLSGQTPTCKLQGPSLLYIFCSCKRNIQITGSPVIISPCSQYLLYPVSILCPRISSQFWPSFGGVAWRRCLSLLPSGVAYLRHVSVMPGIAACLFLAALFACPCCLPLVSALVIS